MTSTYERQFDFVSEKKTGRPETDLRVYDLQLLHASHRSRHQLRGQDILHVGWHGKNKLLMRNQFFLHYQILPSSMPA